MINEDVEYNIKQFMEYDENDCRRIVIPIMYNPKKELITISIEFGDKEENQNLYKVYSNIYNRIEEALQNELKDVFTNKTYKNKDGGLRKCLWKTDQKNMRKHLKSDQGRTDYFKSIPVLVDIVIKAMDEWDKKTKNYVEVKQEKKREYEWRTKRRTIAKNIQNRSKNGSVLTYIICKPEPEASLYVKYLEPKKDNKNIIKQLKF